MLHWERKFLICIKYTAVNFTNTHKHTIVDTICVCICKCVCVYVCVLYANVSKGEYEGIISSWSVERANRQLHQNVKNKIITDIAKSKKFARALWFYFFFFLEYYILSPWRNLSSLIYITVVTVQFLIHVTSIFRGVSFSFLLIPFGLFIFFHFVLLKQLSRSEGFFQN